MSTSIDMVSLLTIIFVMVDDWCINKGQELVQSKPGAKPEFSDSEMLTLMLTQDFVPYPGETQYVGYIRANYHGEFPKLVDQSQYNRRARNLGKMVEHLRQEWLRALGVNKPNQLLLDTKPVPVLGYKRTKAHSEFAGSAGYGHCAARQLNYFGYTLVMLTTVDGLPVVYDLVSANTDERSAAEVVLQQVSHCDIFADKGFIGDDWQADMLQQTGNRVWTMKRANQALQNPPEFDRLLGSIRERIEGTFHCIQNTGRNIERLLAKTVHGLCTRVVLKVTCLVLKRLLRCHFAIDVQSFELLSI
ncbi:MAG: IS982 family transposase [Chloroflexota bacterium]